MQIHGVNHITFSVSDLSRSLAFYESVFQATLLYQDDTTAYLNVGGTWVALNEQRDISRKEIWGSYTHIAFSIAQEEWEAWKAHLLTCNVSLLPSRKRIEGEGLSLYFRDPDGHLLELHTGNLSQRLVAYTQTTRET